MIINAIWEITFRLSVTKPKSTANQKKVNTFKG